MSFFKTGFVKLFSSMHSWENKMFELNVSSYLKVSFRPIFRQNLIEFNEVFNQYTFQYVTQI